MLTSLRTAAGSWVAKLFFVVLVASFAVWGISGQVLGHLGGTSNDVLTIGDTSVSAEQYRLAYDREINALSQRLGTQLTHQQAKTFGVDRQVLGQLVGEAALDEQARRLGLAVSNQYVASITRKDPSFQGPGGKFDRQRFDYVLQQVGMRPQDYLTYQQQAGARAQLVSALTGGLKTPSAFLDAVALYRGEDRTVEFVTLPQSLVEPIANPSDKVLQEWFEKHKKQFAAPEYRKVEYVSLEPADIADPSAVPEADVEQYYKDHLNEYSTPETRTIEQIVFPSKEAAKAAADSIQTGSTFEAIMKGQGKTEKDVTLGTLSKSQIPDAKIANAAFALKLNQVSPVVDGKFGPVLLRVTAINAKSAKPLAEVGDQIRKNLALNAASRKLLDVYDKWEDARAGGATMKEAADKLHLKLATLDAVDRNGETPDGKTVKNIPESDKLLKAAFDTEVAADNEPLNTKDNGFIFYEVEGVTPAHDKTLAEVHDKAVAEWKAEEAASRLGAKAETLRKELEGGKTSLDDIAKTLKLEKGTKRGVKRGADDADLGSAGVAAAFSVPEGKTGLVPGPDGKSQILFKVTQSFEPANAGPDSIDAAAKQSFTNSLSADLLEQMITMLQRKYGLKINQSVIDRAQTY